MALPKAGKTARPSTSKSSLISYYRYCYGSVRGLEKENRHTNSQLILIDFHLYFWQRTWHALSLVTVEEPSGMRAYFNLNGGKTIMSDPIFDQQLDALLNTLEYPVEPIELIDRAEDLATDPDLLIMLRALPEQQYDSRTEIMSHLGQINSLPGEENVYN